jgi:hypothetical protein
MKALRALVSVVVLTACASGVLAQTRPDFSGRWTSDTDPATVVPAAGRGAQRGDMGSGWGSTITVTQDAKVVTVEYAFFGRGDMQPPLRFTYALDGSETKNTVMMGHGMQVETSKTAWDAAKLVITTSHPFLDPASGKPATVIVTRALALESPTSLVVLTTRSGVLGGQSTTTRTVYRKI